MLLNVLSIATLVAWGLVFVKLVDDPRVGGKRSTQGYHVAAAVILSVALSIAVLLS